MATNNIVNNTLDTPTITGATTLNTTSGTVTIGNSSGGILALAANVNSTWSCSNTFNLTTGTGNIVFNGGTKSLGGTSTMSSLNVQTGGGTFTCANSSSPFTITKAGSGDIVITQTGTGSVTISGNSSSGSVSIGSSTVPTQINIGNTSGAFNGTIGNTSAAATSVLITSGTGSINIGTSIAKSISIGNPNGTTLTLSAGSGGFQLPSIEVTGTSAALVQGVFYVANNASLVTLTLPSTAIVGSLIKVAGFGSGGWKIAQLAGQRVFSTAKNTITGTGGSISSGGRYDCVELICSSSNTNWIIKDSAGTLTIV